MGRVNLHSPWAAPTHPKPTRKKKALNLIRRPLRYGFGHDEQEQSQQSPQSDTHQLEESGRS